MKLKIVEMFSLTIFGMLMASPSGQAQTTAKTPKGMARQHARTFKGCLQGDFGSGFLLSTPTGPANSRSAQMMTYKVVNSRDIDLALLANKMVEVTGTLSTAKASAGNVHTMPGSVRETGGAGGRADLAYANGTLTATSIREVAGSCEHDAAKP